MEKQSGIKRVFAAIAAFLPHLINAYAWMTLTFFVINLANDSMGFFSAKTSQHFEIVFTAAALLLAASSFVLRRQRIAAGVTAAAAVAYVIPVIQALAQDSREPVRSAYFSIAALIFGIVSLAYSILMMIAHRRAVKQSADT